jgi:beta-ribofuranosylaminobenzene 5'-phosphate synthase
MMVVVRTPSRLHFGLLAFGPAALRQFGGVGVMVAEPALELEVCESDRLTVEGPLAERAGQFARRCLEQLGTDELPGVALRVLRAPPVHAGLGTGTQLGLAVAQAINVFAGRSGLGVADLARLAGRGLRSAVGTHGFDRGGLIVEGGKRSAEQLAPLVARLSLPQQWRFVLVLPREGHGLHGDAEADAFDRLGTIRPEATDALCRLVLLQLLPAAVEGDFRAFSEAVYEINHRVGECFACCQGGSYATPELAEIVALLRRHGVCGVGQSSWGPTLFALARDRNHADEIGDLLRRNNVDANAELVVTPVCEKGAEVMTNDEIRMSNQPRMTNDE